MIHDVGATWLGCGCIVDALDDSRIRRDLRLRSLLHLRDL
jgi:adenine phosphoribosyltransferase